MNTQRSAAILTVAIALSACGGGSGGSTTVPASIPGTTATVATPSPAPQLSGTPTPSPNPAIHATAYVAAQSVDPLDRQPVALSRAGNGGAIPANAVAGAVHMFPVQQGFSVASTSHARSPRTAYNNPQDLSYYGGTVLGGTVSHIIYVSTNYEQCGTACWGSPGQFLTDLGASGFIGYLDQYIGFYNPNRYTKGVSATANVLVIPPRYPYQYPVISQTDIVALVYEVAQALGTGLDYGNVYHVLLPPATDTCFDLTAACYSPDRPSSFAFCGYHSSLTAGSTHILYTVEPYAYVPGCTYPGSTLNNATANVLSHEMFETITDPDGQGWVRPNDGSEVADICAYYLYQNNLNGNAYILQSEYSNVAHACVNQ